MIVGNNPLPSNPTPLSAPQEQQVRDLYYKNVRAKCAPEIETFASCALGRTFTMIYACRDARLAMNSCMLQYQNQDELDKARQEWFALAGERKKVNYPSYTSILHLLLLLLLLCQCLNGGHEGELISRFRILICF